MVFHAFFYRSDPSYIPKETKAAAAPEEVSAQIIVSGDKNDLSYTREIVAAMFPGGKNSREEVSAPLDPLAQQVRGILRNPVSSYQKVAALMNLAKTLPPDQRRLAYAGAAFVCEPQEFQQLMLPLIWDPSTPPDQAQILAGGVVGLPDPVRLPICLTFLKHRDESIRMTGETVLATYFPEADVAAYPAAVQAYLANPD